MAALAQHADGGKVEEMIAVYPGKITGVVLFKEEFPVRALELVAGPSGLYLPPDEVACCKAIEWLAGQERISVWDLVIETWSTAWNEKQARFIELATKAWLDAAHRKDGDTVTFVSKHLRRRNGDKRGDSFARNLRLGVQAAEALNVDLAQITRPIAEALDLGLFTMAHPRAGEQKDFVGCVWESIENVVWAEPRADSKGSRG